MSSVAPPSKKKQIEKPPKQSKTGSSSASSKSKVTAPMVISQRTSLKIGQKISANGVVEAQTVPPPLQSSASNSNSRSSLSCIGSSFIPEEEPQLSSIHAQQQRHLQESTDILSRMTGQLLQQQQPSLITQSSNESNPLLLVKRNSSKQANSSSNINQQQQQQQQQLLSECSSSPSVSSSTSLSRKQSSNRNNNSNSLAMIPELQQHMQPSAQNGLNFTFMEEEHTELEKDDIQPYNTYQKQQLLQQQEQSIQPLASTTMNHENNNYIGVSNQNPTNNMAGNSKTSSGSRGQDERLGDLLPVHTSTSSSNSSGSGNKSSTKLPHTLLQNSGSSKSSLSNPNVTRFSLTDSFVVKKGGRYFDDYECVQSSSSSNSSKDGKKLIMLGRGGFGQVFLVKQKQGAQEERAMKIVPKGFQEAFREVMMLKKFSHPNVLKIYEYYEDDQNIYVITERCYGYNLFDYIILKGQFTESETCKIADGVLRALSEAHKQGIVHRDVKPDNIMLDFNETRDSFQVKLIDWGLADQLQATQPGEQKYLSKRCGTLHYLAPEVLVKRYNEKVDLWSLGMVLFTLIQGSPPICGKSQAHILEQVQDFQCSFKYQCWKAISDDAKDLILKLLDRDPTKRISAVDALRHPWFARLAGTVVIDTQDLRSSFSNLVRYSHANTFKKTVLGFFASHLITKRERNRFMDIFQVLDTDKNGELSISELKAGFSRLFTQEEHALFHSDIENIFFLSLSAKFEGASGIKYEEFLSSMLTCSETYSADALRQAFQKFDTDNNGKINLDEIINTLEIPPDSEAVASFKQVISSFDENHDGELDFEEFRKVMTNFLDQNSQVILSQEIYLQ